MGFNWIFFFCQLMHMHTLPSKLEIHLFKTSYICLHRKMENSFICALWCKKINWWLLFENTFCCLSDALKSNENLHVMNEWIFRSFWFNQIKMWHIELAHSAANLLQNVSIKYLCKWMVRVVFSTRCVKSSGSYWEFCLVWYLPSANINIDWMKIAVNMWVNWRTEQFAWGIQTIAT